MEKALEEIRKLIGRKVEWHLYRNDAEKGPFNDLTIERVAIYDEYLELKLYANENDDDPDTLYLDDNEFKTFIDGKTYGYAFGDFKDKYEKQYKLREDKEDGR